MEREWRNCNQYFIRFSMYYLVKTNIDSCKEGLLRKEVSSSNIAFLHFSGCTPYTVYVREREEV